MLPKTKKVAQNLKTCKLCAGGIKTEDALQCIYWFLPNTCAQIYSYYAGVTIKHHKQHLDTSSPFKCLYCRERVHEGKINTLQNELDSLKQALAQF